MKRMRKLLSLVLALVMLCGFMSVNTFASSTEATVTVYVTTGMFSPGGYDFDEGKAVLQEYLGGTPTADNYFSTTLGKQEIKISDISTHVTAARACYAAPSTFTGNPNVLDAIYTALAMQSRTPFGGWDAYNSPNGGYLSGFGSDGYATYNTPDEYEAADGTTYDVYTGTGWQIACTQSGTITECSTYGTNYSLYDGMVIVFDLSAYTIYYPQS